MTSLGKSNIEQELKLILQKQENVNEVGTSDCGSKDADVPLAGCNFLCVFLSFVECILSGIYCLAN
jgi:hypothetical protein